MPLTEAQLTLACEVLSAAPTLREAAHRWRAREPAVRAIVVDALDMRGETPARQLGARSVWLAATNGHCWRVTARLEEATALILAQNAG